MNSYKISWSWIHMLHFMTCEFRYEFMYMKISWNHIWNLGYQGSTGRCWAMIPRLKFASFLVYTSTWNWYPKQTLGWLGQRKFETRSRSTLAGDPTRSESSGPESNSARLVTRRPGRRSAPLHLWSLPQTPSQPTFVRSPPPAIAPLILSIIRVSLTPAHSGCYVSSQNGSLTRSLSIFKCSGLASISGWPGQWLSLAAGSY